MEAVAQKMSGTRIVWCTVSHTDATGIVGKKFRPPLKNSVSSASPRLRVMLFRGAKVIGTKFVLCTIP